MGVCPTTLFCWLINKNSARKIYDCIHFRANAQKSARKSVAGHTLTSGHRPPLRATLLEDRACDLRGSSDDARAARSVSQAPTHRQHDRVARADIFSKRYLVEALPNIKIWRLAPNFDIWKDFNYSQYSVEVRRTSTDELSAGDLGNKRQKSGNPGCTQKERRINL